MFMRFCGTLFAKRSLNVDQFAKLVKLLYERIDIWYGKDID